jgi:hypothetical protein
MRGPTLSLSVLWGGVVFSAIRPQGIRDRSRYREAGIQPALWILKTLQPCVRQRRSRGRTHQRRVLFQQQGLHELCDANVRTKVVTEVDVAEHGFTAGCQCQTMLASAMEHAPAD